MVTETDLATTRIAMSYELEPTRNVVGDLSGLVGEFCEHFVAAFYPRGVSRKANVVVTELFTNAVMHESSGDSTIRVDLTLEDGQMAVRVKNAATPEQCRLVRSRVRTLNDASNPRQILADTIRHRHSHRLQGGLGLMRLVAENKFSLSAKCRNGILTVQARIDLGGLA